MLCTKAKVYNKSTCQVHNKTFKVDFCTLLFRVCTRGCPVFLGKTPCKVFWVIEPYVVGDFRDIHILALLIVYQHLPSNRKTIGPDKMPYGLAESLLQPFVQQCLAHPHRFTEFCYVQLRVLVILPDGLYQFLNESVTFLLNVGLPYFLREEYFMAGQFFILPCEYSVLACKFLGLEFEQFFLLGDFLCAFHYCILKLFPLSGQMYCTDPYQEHHRSKDKDNHQQHKPPGLIKIAGN